MTAASPLAITAPRLSSRNTASAMSANVTNVFPAPTSSPTIAPPYSSSRARIAAAVSG
jgi:hypothetical protein